MTTLILRAVFSLLIELIVRRAMCKVLDMKSVPIYLALCLVCYCTSYAMQVLGVNNVLRALIISPLSNFVLPFVMSYGPVGMRLTRITFVNVGILGTEVSGSVLYYLISGHAFPGSFVDLDPMTIVVIYTILVLLTTVICEASIAFFRRSDSRWDTEFEPAALVMMVYSFVFFSILVIRYDLSGVTSLAVPLVTALCVILAIAIDYLMLGIARKDARTKRDLALQIAKKRQVKHLMEEVGHITARSVSMRHLRHDLANQIGIVRTLVEQGHTEEADRYLATLQELARRIAQPDDNAEAQGKEAPHE